MFMKGRTGFENMRVTAICRGRGRGRGEGADMGGWESLVEAEIDAICADSANKEVRLEMTCAWEGNDRMRIVATGVDDFVVNEMRLSNVVDRVSRFDAGNIKDEGDEVARHLFFLMRGKDPSPSDLEWPALRAKLARIQDGALGLLEVKPVHGVTVVVLAGDFRFEPVS